MIHIVKDIGIFSKAVGVFLELSCYFDDQTDVGNLISDSSAFTIASLYIWKFLVHILLKPSLKDFEHYLDSMWNECNCTAVWTFSGIALLLNWNENWPFPVLWPLVRFPNLLKYRVQHFNTINFFGFLSRSAETLSPPLAVFIVMLPKTYLTSHSKMPDPRWVTISSCILF